MQNRKKDIEHVNENKISSVFFQKCRVLLLYQAQGQREECILLHQLEKYDVQFLC